MNRLRGFAERSLGNQIRLNVEWDKILQEFGDEPIPAGAYLLLKTCLPGTKGKTYQEQLEVLMQYPEYKEATLSEVLVVALMEYIQSGESKTQLFRNEYARTCTTLDNRHLDFGGFSANWPCIHDDDVGDSADNIGLAVVLRVKESNAAIHD